MFIHFIKTGWMSQKLNYSKREFQMPPLVMQELKKWKKFCPENELNLVFPSEIGTFSDADNMIKRRFQIPRFKAYISDKNGWCWRTYNDG